MNKFLEDALVSGQISEQELLDFASNLGKGVKPVSSFDNVSTCSSSLVDATSEIAGNSRPFYSSRTVVVNSESTSKSQEEIEKALENRDFSRKIVIQEDKFFPTPNPYTKDVEKQIEELIKCRQHSNPIRNAGYAKVLAGVQSYGQFLASPEGIAIRAANRRRNIVKYSTLSGKNKRFYNLPSGRQGLLQGQTTLANIINYAVYEELPKLDLTFYTISEQDLQIWLHNAVHFVYTDPLYAAIADQADISGNSFNTDVFLCTLLTIFENAGATPEEFVFALCRNTDNDGLNLIQKCDTLDDREFRRLVELMNSAEYLATKRVAHYMNAIENVFKEIQCGMIKYMGNLLNACYEPDFALYKNKLLVYLTHAFKGIFKSSQHCMFDVNGNTEKQCNTHWSINAFNCLIKLGKLIDISDGILKQMNDLKKTTDCEKNITAELITFENAFLEAFNGLVK